jgi:hypothetical protein
MPSLRESLTHGPRSSFRLSGRLKRRQTPRHIELAAAFGNSPHNSLDKSVGESIGMSISDSPTDSIADSPVRSDADSFTLSLGISVSVLVRNSVGN